jgi:hypothetical protein
MSLTTSVVAALVAALLPGCSSHRTIGRDEVSSALRQCRSFAAESEMYIDFALRGSAGRTFTEQHAAYLEDAVDQSGRELDEAVPAADVAAAARICRTALDLLGRELSGIRGAALDTDKLAAARERIARIRKNIEEVAPTL